MCVSYNYVNYLITDDNNYDLHAKSKKNKFEHFEKVKQILKFPYFLLNLLKLINICK